MRRAINAMQVLGQNFDEIPFDGQWLELFGTPELSGCWLIWGESSNGKTSFAFQLAKYLSKFARVAYDSLEEGVSKSLKYAIEREKMYECGNRFLILDKEPIAELEERIQKHKSPSIYIIDSVQYTGLNKLTAKEFVDRYPSKLFIFISHASGKLPEGRTALAIRYHADVKIRVEGFRAFIQSRYGGDREKYMTIYTEGAEKYWNYNNQKL